MKLIASIAVLALGALAVQEVAVVPEAPGITMRSR